MDCSGAIECVIGAAFVVVCTVLQGGGCVDGVGGGMVPDGVAGALVAVVEIGIGGWGGGPATMVAVAVAVETVADPPDCAAEDCTPSDPNVLIALTNSS